MDFVFPTASLMTLSLFDVLLWPVVAAVAGFAIWAVGCRLEDDDGSQMVKWLAGVPLVLGLINGGGWISKVLGSSPEAVMYRDAIGGRKMLFAHIGAFAFPLVVVIALVVWYVARKRADV